MNASEVGYRLEHEQKKIALVLAGGGLTGAVYEIGALRAIDALMIDRTVNDFDIYVGTSAGAFVGSMLANGVHPEVMMRSLDGAVPHVKPIARHDIFNIRRSELARFGGRLPDKLTKAWLEFLGNATDMTIFDFFWSLLEALPAGFYDSQALGSYVEHVIKRVGKSVRFQELDRELHIIATDLDSGERAIFNRETPEVSIPEAVAASSAVPIVYKPVRIQGNEYIDGGMRGNASLDVAIERGASVVVCINPMVPYDNSDHRSMPAMNGDSHYISEKGVNFIANQITRIVTHSTIRYHIKQLRRSHPEVDIILIEPRSDDYQMFFYNPMRYSARMSIAKHGYESVALGMAADYQYYKDTLARHGIHISRRRAIKQLDQLRAAGDEVDLIRGVLEGWSDEDTQRTKLTRRLDQTLDALDEAIARL